MGTMTIKSVFQFRRATSLEWESVNPVLRIGEPAYVTDLHKHKIGDGVTAWNDLPYQDGEEYVVNRKTHYDFPSIGKENIIYKSESEKKLYQWNTTELKYEPLDEPSVLDVEMIYGGAANITDG